MLDAGCFGRIDGWRDVFFDIRDRGWAHQENCVHIFECHSVCSPILEVKINPFNCVSEEKWVFLYISYRSPEIFFMGKQANHFTPDISSCPRNQDF